MTIFIQRQRDLVVFLSGAVIKGTKKRRRDLEGRFDVVVQVVLGSALKASPETAVRS